MSPFRSKSQMKAAFGGYLGKEMQQKAKGWAEETPNIKALPEHKKKKKSDIRRTASYSNGGITLK